MLGKIVSPNTTNIERHLIINTKAFQEWRSILQKHMGHLSRPQLTVLALWSYGIVLSQACGLNRVSATLASHLGQKESAYRQRLREWCWDQPDKQGKRRTEWAVQQSFGPLLQWILSLWAPEERRLVLAMDATSLKQVFVVLSISVVYRGCALPVAWAVLPEGQKGSWKEPWLELFALLGPSVPQDWCVLVMADRGLYARWVFEGIQQQGWHPFLRINLRNQYCLPGEAQFRPLRQLLSAPGTSWAGRLTCFASNSVQATLLACWEAAYQEPWLILTDLPPDSGLALWYGLRSWIECGFKDLKRDGWQWQKTRMTHPARAARFWLALAVATLWVVTVGGQADAHLLADNAKPLPAAHIARKKKVHPSPPRQLSCFTRGCILVRAMLIHQLPLLLGPLIPQPWPCKTYP
jgi:hypothetical protein